MVLLIVCILFGGYIFSCRLGIKARTARVVMVFLGAIIGFYFAHFSLPFFFGALPHSIEYCEFGRIGLVKIGSNADFDDLVFVFSTKVKKEKQYVFSLGTYNGQAIYGMIPAGQAKIFEDDWPTAYLAGIFKKNKYSSQTYFWLIPEFFVTGKSCGTMAIHIPRGMITYGLSAL